MTFMTPFSRGSLLDRLVEDLDDSHESYKETWQAPVQIKKSEKDYRVLVKIPGMRKEDIKIEVEDGYLKIFGEYENKKEEDYEAIHSEFRTYKKFYRSLALELSRFDVDKIDAKFCDGILEVALPLHAKAQPKQISIKPV